MEWPFDSSSFKRKGVGKPFSDVWKNWKDMVSLRGFFDIYGINETSYEYVIHVPAGYKLQSYSFRTDIFYWNRPDSFTDEQVLTHMSLSARTTITYKLKAFAIDTCTGEPVPADDWKIRTEESGAYWSGKLSTGANSDPDLELDRDPIKRGKPVIRTTSQPDTGLPLTYDLPELSAYSGGDFEAFTAVAPVNWPIQIDDYDHAYRRLHSKYPLDQGIYPGYNLSESTSKTRRIDGSSNINYVENYYVPDRDPYGYNSFQGDIYNSSSVDRSNDVWVGDFVIIDEDAYNRSQSDGFTTKPDYTWESDPEWT